MVSVLVTGASGFIGRHAVRALVAGGVQVTGVGRGGTPGDLAGRCDWINADLLTSTFDWLHGAERHFDILLHLAWETEHGAFWTAPSNLEWVAASLRLVAAFCEQGGQRVICSGTCVEYVAPASGPCRVEHTPVKPTHLYAIAKDAFHQALIRRASTTDLSYVWARVFFAYGEGEGTERLVAQVIRGLLRGEVVNCSSGRQIRDFMDVRDCGAAFALLCLSDFEGALNLCSGEPVTIAQIVEQIAQLHGHPERVRLGALPDRAQEPANLWGDASLLHEQVGFVPAYRLHEGLAHALRWWQSAPINTA